VLAALSLASLARLRPPAARAPGWTRRRPLASRREVVVVALVELGGQSRVRLGDELLARPPLAGRAA
jgi:hypothetical protein